MREVERLTNSKTHYRSSNEHQSHCALACPQSSYEHQQISQTGCGKTSKYSWSSAFGVCKERRKHGAHCTTQIVDRDDDTHHGITLCQAHRLKIVIIGVDQGHHPLIVAIEGNGGGGEQNYLRLLVHVLSETE